MTANEDLLSEFKSLVDEIHEFNIVLYAFLYKANVVWDESHPTAAVAINNGRATFYFNPTFWTTLTVQEKLFLILHECYHVFLFHFTRFTSFDSVTNAALDVAVNHSLLRHFSFTEDQLPYLRVNGCWCDTVLPGQVLLDTLSAEEYLLILRMNQPQMMYIQMDAHGGLDEGDMEEIKEALGKDMKELFPEKSDQEIKDLLSDFEKETKAKLAGTGSFEGKPVVAITKKKKTWQSFAKKLQKMFFDSREESAWLPHKRLRHLETNGMRIPSSREEEQREKVNVILLLDTSGSCTSYQPHFLGFAKALPKEYFNVHVFGFNTRPYKVDMKDPHFKGGGTSFSFFQDVYDSVPGEKIVFVFTDGEGSECKLKHPQLWHWFMYSYDRCTHYIPKECKIHRLDDFE
jgi:hypothetical protein